MTKPAVIEDDITDNVALIRINRPEVLNALNLAALNVLVEAVDKHAANPDVCALVITGGPHAFCTGEDLREATRLTSAQFLQQVEQFQRLADLLRNAPQPVIAAVAGPAVGGGLEIAVDCDLRIAADNATFSCPEVHWGLTVTNGASVLLRQLVGEGWARELTLFGTTLDAAAAERIGLVTRVVPVDQLEAQALALAHKVASNDPSAMALTKMLLNADPRPWTTVLDSETAAVTKGFHTEEVQARLASFGAGRSPNESTLPR